MSQLTDRLEQLSPQKRELLLRRLQQRPAAPGARPALPEITALPAITALPRDGRSFPLSYAQQRLWFLDQLDPGTSAYNLPAAVRLAGRLDEPALARALTAVVARHEPLRTAFPAEAGKPVQRIAAAPIPRVSRAASTLPASPPSPSVPTSAAAALGPPPASPTPVTSPPASVPLPVVDLSGLPLPAAAREDLARGLAATAVRRPFDLASGPPLRALLLRLAPELRFLVLTVHHIATDGWSMGILVREATALYAGFAGGAPALLPALPVQYADFAAAERRWLDAAAIAARLDYWRRRLGGLDGPLDLPADRPRPQVQSFRGGRQGVALHGAPVAALRALAHAEGTTLFTVLLGALMVLLQRYSGRDDLTVGAPVANRDRPEIEPLIGFFVNTLVLRGDLAGDPTFRELVARLREATLEDFARRDLPFEQLVEELQPDRDLAHSPLFQVMLAFQSLPPAAAPLGELAAEPLALETGRSMFDLSLALDETPTSVAGAFEYNRDLFDAWRMRRMAEHWAALLAGLAAQPGRRLSELALLAAAERQQVLTEWNDSAADYQGEWQERRRPARPRRAGAERPQPAAERDLCVHELIAARAALTPDAVAVVYETSSLSYAELERRSAVLAARLAGLGVGPEARVGLAVERSLEMMVGLLAILEAGAAYVPLDAAYPRDRLAFMVEDAMAGQPAAVVLSQRRLAGRLPEGGATTTIFVDDLGDLGDLDDLDGLGGAARRGEPADRDSTAAVTEPPVAAGSARRATPDNLVYVIYTSGSTGRPKGVMNAHRAVANRLLWEHHVYGMTAAARVLQKTPISFDVSVWELFWPLLAGATLVVARPGGHQDSAYLARVIAEQRITDVHFVPSMLQAFLEHPAAAGLDSVRRVYASGEALPADLARRCQALLPAAELYNLYGPTEAAVEVTAWRCEAGVRRAAVPIGRPVGNAHLHVLEIGGGGAWVGGPAPAGVPGELCIGGLPPARGYLNRPDLTAERFVPDPFGARWGRPGGRLYRTGDLARHDAFGAIEFLGRIDRQVKLRGFRIELGEIESALESHPDVERAVATVEDGAGGGRLVAYVVPRGADAAPEAAARLAALLPALRAHLGERLPEHMVPTAWAALERLPLTGSGKVDRRRLAAVPAAAAAGARPSSRPPATPAEELVAAIWEEVLGVEAVTAGDSFFELGGHSLLATQVVARVRDAWGVELPLRALFERPTVAALAAHLEALKLGGEAAAAPPIAAQPRAGGTARLPMSFGQRRLWFLDQLEPGSAAYNLPAAVRLRGTLDAAALAASLAEVVRRHEVLRTTFALDGEEPVQVIGAAAPRAQAAPAPAAQADPPPAPAPRATPPAPAAQTSAAPVPAAQTPAVPAAPAPAVPAAPAPAAPVPAAQAAPSTAPAAQAVPAPAAPAVTGLLPCVDLAALPAARRDAVARRLLAAAAGAPFDLGAGPILRALLLRLGAAEHVLLVVVHHIASDGWSMGLLVREVSRLYAALSRGEASPLPALPLQYADFAAWQRGWLQGEALAAQIAYWRQALAGAPPLLDLPTDRPRPLHQTFNGTRLVHRLDAALGGALRALGRARGATPFMVHLAAFQALVSRYSGQPVVVVGSPIANRRHAALEGLIGFFVNTLALAGDLTGDPSFAGHLVRVRETALGAYAHQDLPFEKLVEELEPRRSLAHAPLVQVLLSVQNTPPAAPVELAGLEAEPLAAEMAVTKFDLTFELVERGGAAGDGGCEVGVEYNTDLFDAARIRRMVGHWTAMLAGLVADPERRLSELPLLAAAERHQLLVEVSDTAAAYAWEGRVDELVERRAAIHPERAAVSCGDETITYGELLAAAGQLAGRLRGLGLARGEAVAMGLGRSVRLVPALLGIWKAGGAYVPMDPTYPEDRLLYMLGDAGCRLLLADETTPPALLAAGPRTLWMRRQDREVELAAPPAPPLAAAAGEPGDLAYILYTSGSTGRPKGVEVAHGSVANLMLSMAERPGLRADDVLLAVTSLSFDVSGVDMYLPLLQGARIEVVQRELAADGLRLLARLERTEATVLQATPSAFGLLVEAGWRRTPALRAWSGGEALPDRLAAELVARSGEVWNVYGPTEATVYAAIDRVEAGAPVRLGPAPANSSLHVVTPGLEAAPVGVAGELWVGGACLARGYRGRPELTAERFVPDPFGGADGAVGGAGAGDVGAAGTAGARLYRTGDLVRHDGRGRIEYLGRIDHQVKIRGFRIELGEIEATLAAHPNIADAVVVSTKPRSAALVVQGSGGDSRLVAYVVGRETAAPPAGELRAFLASRLPGYMVPWAFVPLAALPRTANGKLDRKSLPDPERGAWAAATPLEEPRTDAERTVAAIWQDVLGLDRVGVHDNFFDSGGHSLLTMRVYHRAKAAFGRDFPLVALFEHPTVEALAAYLGRPQESAAPSSALRQVGQDRGARRRQAALKRRAIPGGAGSTPGAGAASGGGEGDSAAAEVEAAEAAAVTPAAVAESGSSESLAAFETFSSFAGTYRGDREPQ